MVPYFVRIHLGLFSQKSVKGQVLVDFLAGHPSLEIEIEQSVEGVGNLWSQKRALDPQI